MVRNDRVEKPAEISQTGDKGYRLEDVYDKMYVGACCRFRAMGIEFAAVQRGKEKDFVFYDEKVERSAMYRRNAWNLSTRSELRKKNQICLKQQPNEAMEDSLKSIK